MPVDRCGSTQCFRSNLVRYDPVRCTRSPMVGDEVVTAENHEHLEGGCFRMVGRLWTWKGQRWLVSGRGAALLGAVFLVCGALFAATPSTPASAQTWNCTADAFQACSFSNDPGWDEYNNPWNNPAMPPNSYVLSSDSHSNWQVVANQAQCPTSDCAVEAYESAQYNYDNTSGEETISEISQMTSDFSQSMPTGSLGTNGFDAEAAYDIWLNNYALEVMIWVDNQGQTPTGSEVGTADLGGTNYTVFFGGSTYSFVIDNNETSGTVNIQDALDWLVSNEGVSSSSYMTQFNFGWEICSTDGQSDTFTMNSLDLNQSFN